MGWRPRSQVGLLPGGRILRRPPCSPSRWQKGQGVVRFSGASVPPLARYCTWWRVTLRWWQTGLVQR